MNSSLTKGPGALVGGANEAAELAATLSSAGPHDTRMVTRVAAAEQRGELADNSL